LPFLVLSISCSISASTSSSDMVASSMITL
jgi:hypothetical protein